MRALSDGFEDRSCRIRPFVGKVKPKGAMDGFLKLSKADSEEKISEQWRSLQRQFSLPTCVLIFHLTNHYALVYALREWADPETGKPAASQAAFQPASATHCRRHRHRGLVLRQRPRRRCPHRLPGHVDTRTVGEVCRQILTTRRGQRPTVWIDWTEVRSTIIKWTGYKLLAVERTL